MYESSENAFVAILVTSSCKMHVGPIIKAMEASGLVAMLVMLYDDKYFIIKF